MIDLSKNTDPLIANCLKAIKSVAEELDIDFFVVGAVVRDLILGQLYGLPTGLETKDIDLGITVKDWEHYQKMKDRLISTGSFSSDEKTVHRLIYKNSCPVDIIPFGSVETSEGLNDRIHSFHQKTSSELWKTYSSMEDDFLVCRAVKLGFLSKEDVPEKVAGAIPVLE
ncbi:MAG: hypothetical protein ISS64_07460 [Desulfobacterales bacterium]|nr:hypothetical protein [Desulfobacterales bacterium]